MNSRSSHYLLIAVAMLLIFGNCSHASPQAEDPSKQNSDGIEFRWNEADWKDVIEWFADQAGLTLDKVDQYPQGAFSLTSDRPYTPVEAIDELNHKLRLSDPPMTLLRNGERLYLVDATRALPAELVETIDVSELDQRGKYETLQVIFDVTGLDFVNITDQIDQRVQPYNKAFFQSYEDTNEIFVRESGENLRFIRDLVSRALAAGTPQWSELNLKHINAELFLQQIRGVYDLDDNYSNPDGTLKMLVDSTAGAERIVVRGTPALLVDLKNAVKMFDKEPASIESQQADPAYLKIYSVPRDSKEAFQVIDRLLFEAGGTARVIQGSETNKITVMGRNKDHETVQEYLGLASSGGGLQTVHLKNGGAFEILTKARIILGITAENAADNVSMLENTDRDFIVLRGEPGQVAAAVQVIEELDRNAAPITEGLRTPRRVIPMAPEDRDRILESLDAYLPTLGRDNFFELRPPQNSEQDDDSLFRRRETELKRQPMGSSTRDQDSSTRDQGSSTRRRGSSTRRRGSTMRDQSSLWRSKAFEIAILFNPSIAASMSTTVLQEAQNDVAETRDGDVYQAPEQVKSVPGSPVRIWGTDFGIVVESDDLDAGEDVIFLIDGLIGEESVDAKPRFYQLKYRKASEMKQLLESIYGLESSSGGDGGGSGVLGAIADNVMGEAGGGVVDSLFGGGFGSGAESSSSLEGSVSIGVDGVNNYLWVIGATENDLSAIDDLIDLFDVSTPPHNPETGGQLYEIQVMHRDVEVMKTTIESLMSNYFSDGNPQGGANGGGGGGGEAANAMRMLRQLGGGGGGNGGGGGADDVQPHGSLVADAKTGKLLFFGPKFILVQIQGLVATLDQPEVESPRIMKQLNIEGGDAGRLAEMLKEILGADKIEISGDVDEMPATGEPSPREGQQRSNQPSQRNNEQREALEALRSLQNRGAGGSRGGGGGNRGGGGGNRGGGGGNRGGGR